MVKEKAKCGKVWYRYIIIKKNKKKTNKQTNTGGWDWDLTKKLMTGRHKHL
jgi:hypothetical protein